MSSSLLGNFVLRHVRPFLALGFAVVLLGSWLIASPSRGAGPAEDLIFIGLDDPIVRGATDSFTVRAVDQDGLTATTYTGTVSFTATAGSGVTLPANSTLPNGEKTFTVKWTNPNDAGGWSLTVKDTVNAAMTDTRDGISVTEAVDLQLAGVADPIVRGGTDFFTVRAVDQYGTLDPLYTGTVMFTPSSGGGASALPNYAFTTSDAGDHDFSVKWTNPGNNWTLTVKDTIKTSLTDSKTGITVTSAVDLELLSVADPIVRGGTDFFTVRAVDQYGTTDPLYTGTVSFTPSAGGGASALPNYTFTASDNGDRDFSFSWTNTGDWSITVKDTVKTAMTDTRTKVTVTKFVDIQLLSVADPIVRGGTDFFTVRAVDQYGSTDPLYTGTVSFTPSGGGGASALPNYTFTTSDAGDRDFSVKWTNPGDWSLSVTDTVTTSARDTRTGITVTKAVDLQLLSVADPIVRGGTDFFTVRAVDQYGTTDPLYAGTVSFTPSGGGGASALPNYTFTTSDAGDHDFSVKWTNPGDWDLLVKDTATSSMADTWTKITVTKAVDLQLLSVADPITRGATDHFTVRAVDQYGTTDPLYAGTVSFALSPGSGASALPNYTFQPSDLGDHDFQVVWGNAGEWSLQVTDTGVSTLSDTRNGISVLPSADLRLEGVNSPIVRGTADSFTVRVVDKYGNTDTKYTGTVKFVTAGAPSSSLPNYTFTAGDNGIRTFSVTWSSNGTASLHVEDVADATMQATRNNLNVTKATVLKIEGINDPIARNTADAFTVRAVDQFGSQDPLYTGTVTFTPSPGGGASGLPTPNYTFTAADAGARAFSVTWANPGEWSLTVSDGTISATQNAITVT